MGVVRKFTVWFTSLATICLVGLPLVHGEEMSYSQLVSEVEALKAQLNSQQADFASFSMGGSMQKDDYGKGKGACCNSGGVYAGYELTLLQPTDLFGINTPDQYEPGHRFTLGAENASGFGGRVRYWYLDQSYDLPDFAQDYRIDMDVIDLEATVGDTFCNFDVLFSGGIRYGRAGFNFQPFFIDPDEAQTYFEGVGPTVSLAVSRNVGYRGLYVLGNFRGSQLFGDWNNLLGGADQIDDTMTVLESQLGVGWTADFSRASVDARLVWESQTWTSDFDANTAVTTFAFSGPTLGITVRR